MNIWMERMGRTIQDWLQDWLLVGVLIIITSACFTVVILLETTGPNPLTSVGQISYPSPLNHGGGIFLERGYPGSFMNTDGLLTIQDTFMNGVRTDSGLGGRKMFSRRLGDKWIQMQDHIKLNWRSE